MELNICPSCNSPDTVFLAHGIVAPWIMELCNEFETIFTKYLKCNQCTLAFFSYRYNENQMSSIYSTYRRGDYFKLRNKWEPWYRKSENDPYGIEINAKNVESRRNTMETVLRQAKVEPSEEGPILDFGGDKGQFFPGKHFGKKYLLDPSIIEENISNHKDGIKRVKRLEELQEKMSLILCCGVLEHLSNPVDVLAEISDTLGWEGIFYFEVPLDGFKVGRLHRTVAYLKYLQFLSRRRRAFILMDFVTGVCRTLFGRVPFCGIVKQSEHINYFNRNSCFRLIESKFNIIHMTKEDKGRRQGIYRLGFLGGVASKRSIS